MNTMFSTRQEKIISSAVTGLALLTLAALTLFLFRTLVRFLGDFSSVLLPLAAAGVLSLLLRPLYQKLQEKWKFPPLLAVAVIFILLLLPAVIILGVFGNLLVQQINELFKSIPESVAGFQAWLEKNAPAVEAWLEKVGGIEQFEAWMEGSSQQLLDIASGGARGILQVAGAIAGVFSWVVLPVYLFFLLIAPPFNYDKLEDFFPFLKDEQKEDVVFLIQQFVDIVVVFFRGQLVIAFAQGMMMAIGFSICGLKYGFILGLIFGLLNLVPYLGNLVGLSITLPLAWLQPEGGLGVLIGVLVVLGITQVVEGYVLTPRIMGKSTGLHPMAVIFSMFFWGKAMGGIIGLILAIPLTAFLVVFWRLAKEKYFHMLEPAKADGPE